MELELTSDRGDGTWTWRAAGARQPKGVVDAGLLPGGTGVGAVVRAEVERDLEGFRVLHVQGAPTARREPERLEILGSQRPFEPVTSTLVRGSRSDDRPRRERPPRGDRPRDGDRRPPRRSRDGRPSADRPRGESVEPARQDRPARPPRPSAPAPEPRPKAKRLRPGRVHRNALLAEVPPEQRAIAEQLLDGGLPAVRVALAEQNRAAKADNRPAVPVNAVLTIAESLLVRVRVAEWLDRAEAAEAIAEEVSLRDLHSVVTSGEELVRDDRVRELEATLKGVLERRTEAEAAQWYADVALCLDGGRVVRALRLSSQAPDASTNLPAELHDRLVAAAAAAMTPDVASDRYATLVDALAFSPVRRAVVPVGIPADPDAALIATVRKHARRVPAIAGLFGESPPSSGAPTGSRRAAKIPPPPPQVGTRDLAEADSAPSSTEAVEPESVELNAEAPSPVAASDIEVGAVEPESIAND